VGAWLGAAALGALFLTNGWFRLRGLAPEELFRTWRSYDDFAIAAGYAVRGVFPVAPYRVRDFIRRDRDPRFREFKQRLLAEIAANDIRSSTFWRTFPAGSASPDGRWLVAKRFDDSGRAWLLGVLFGALGGAAPFLLFWLAILAAAPILSWTSLEFTRVGYPVAGAVFVAALSGSAFVIDVLALGYSAIGFHVVAVLVLAPIAAYATLGRPTVRGLLGRAAVSGVLVGVCAVCRGTVVSLLPGFALALAIGSHRALAAASRSWRSRGRSGALWLAALGLLAAPYLGLRTWAEARIGATRDAYGREPMPLYHDAALLIWKGLGDFDTTKGYAFRDKAGELALQRVDPRGLASRDSEALLRDVILNDIREDPLWFVGILAKRLAATVSLYKLWPWAPRDGTSIYPARTENEGVIDHYYGLTMQADWYRIGPWTGELPVSLVLAPTLLLLAAACVPARLGRLRGASSVARRSLPLLACLAAAVLPTPVLITTATALESECFVLVHALAAAFLAEAARQARGAVTAAAGGPPGPTAHG
jgi:hypothetical protein